MGGPLATRRHAVHIVADPGRVITKPFIPRDDPHSDGSSRLEVLVERILGLSAEEAADNVAAVRESFGQRHRNFDAAVENGFRRIARQLTPLDIESRLPSANHRYLVGAYFTHEYSIEAAALGNPSIVAAPDQTGVDEGSVRFVMSLRAIGEGHISSIAFRTGIISNDLTMLLDPASGYAATGERARHAHEKSFFATKLHDLGMLNEIVTTLMDRLPDHFTISELEEAIERLDELGIERSLSGESTRVMHWLASSNYRLSFDESVELSERVLFPGGPTESQGMEDARFVRFTDDDGGVVYYATYTAFDGHQILPQLLETADFRSFRVSTLTGAAAQNKGVALFPRKINGRYVALNRHDGVNNSVMTSHDVRVWRTTTLIQQPNQPWELMQLGNCGSPLETDRGWLVITHGVGPMRQYALGALLLDLDDPTVVIGHLDEPLLTAAPDEREGYVPNVVYSCGSMIHAGHLVLPYGYADVGTRVATIELDSVLSRLTRR
jgi:predicted GH43/DUF377 family glycosyl hydrolase